MSTCAGRPPELSPEKVSAIVNEHFRFHSIVKESVRNYPSFSDRNYYFAGRTNEHNKKREYVLKISNPFVVQEDELKGINQLMNYLKSLGLNKSYPLTTASGDYAVPLSHAQLTVEERPNCFNNSPWSGTEDEAQALNKVASPGAGDLVYYVRVLMFVPGDLLHHVGRAYFVPPLLHSIGEILGKVDKALMVCCCRET